jgi:hypothetical protein
MPPDPKAEESTEALRAACAGSADLAPAFEKLKAESASTVDAALDLARTARKTQSGQMRAVTAPLTGKFKALK